MVSCHGFFVWSRFDSRVWQGRYLLVPDVCDSSSKLRNNGAPARTRRMPVPTHARTCRAHLPCASPLQPSPSGTAPCLGNSHLTWPCSSPLRRISALAPPTPMSRCPIGDAPQAAPRRMQAGWGWSSGALRSQRGLPRPRGASVTPFGRTFLCGRACRCAANIVTCPDVISRLRALNSESVLPASS